MNEYTQLSQNHIKEVIRLSHREKPISTEEMIEVAKAYAFLSLTKEIHNLAVFMLFAMAITLITVTFIVITVAIIYS